MCAGRAERVRTRDGGRESRGLKTRGGGRGAKVSYSTSSSSEDTSTHEESDIETSYNEHYSDESEVSDENLHRNVLESQNSGKEMVENSFTDDTSTCMDISGLSFSR